MRERNIDLLFHLFMHPLADSYMCPDQGSNLQPWRIRTVLSPAEPPTWPGLYLFFQLLTLILLFVLIVLDSYFSLDNIICRH